MINFNYEIDFELHDGQKVSAWISDTIINEERKEGEINYIFCDDLYLHKLNVEFLDHDTLTDIISFDYTVGNELHGDVFISIDRVKDNAEEYGISVAEEVRRVMVHGVLHYCGYKDKTTEDSKVMRDKENHYLSLLT